MLNMKSLIASFVCFLAVTIGAARMANADIIFDFAQQSGVAENTGLRRAVYLGRLFNGQDGGPFRRMDSMYAAITLAQASGVRLFVGNGSTNFDNALAQGRMTDTGIRVTNSEQNRTETIFIPGSFTPGQIGPNAPFQIDEQAGTAIFNSLATNKRLDFWLVGDSNSGFTVPSTVGGDPAFFIAQFHTTVPEPTSILLAGAGVGYVVARMRGKKSKKQSASTEVR
jgi:hypothetical protein